MVIIFEQGDSPLLKKMAFGGGVAVYEKNNLIVVNCLHTMMFSFLGCYSVAIGSV